MSRGRIATHLTARIALCACLALVLTGVVTPIAAMAAPNSPNTLGRAKVKGRVGQQTQPDQGQRIVLGDVTGEIVPKLSNIWQCSCDNDGCWPGCFTIASATILKYWSQKGFPNLWDGDENGTLQKLRDVFPNLFCYNNKDDDGVPSDSGYDAFDVAKGFEVFVQQRGYKFAVKAIPAPKFEQITREIDAGRPVIGAFGISPWGSHAGTVIGYDTTGGRQVMIVRPNLLNKNDTELTWGVGYGEFGIVTISPNLEENGGANPSLDIEVVVNDTDAGFSVTGNWQLSNLGLGQQSHYAQTTDPSNLGPTTDTAVATWTPTLPFDGLWEVYAWVPREDTDDTAVPLATYRINTAEGQSLVRRTQNKARVGWMPLGTFPFVRGEKGAVQIGNMTGDNPLRNVWADAMKFVWRAPLAVQSEAGGPAFIVVNGSRRAIPDDQTLEALKLTSSQVRKLSPLELDQYPPDEMVPSVMSRWVGAYYNNTLLSPPATSIHADASLNFRWNGAAPAAGIDAKSFSARWTRYFATTEGDYPFSVNAVGGVRLWVDGQLQINDWDTQPGLFVKHEKQVKLPAGLHRVDVEYVNRDGYAQISFGNLPPNVPITLDATAGLGVTISPTATLRWQDSGDVDTVGNDTPRKFFATLWNEATGWRASSGWSESTEWTVSWPQDGTYWWSIISSDGQANSDSSRPRQIRVDRTAPWAQMVSASTTASMTEPTAAGAKMIDAFKLISDVNGNMTVQSGGAQVAASGDVRSTAVMSQLGNLPAIRVTWLGKDGANATSDGLHYDVQVRETVHASTEYTIVVENREVTRMGSELTLSGTEEITTPVVLTEVVPITTVAPLITLMPITDSQWITFATGITQSEAIFIGEPGSTYEFRVRATDGAGNAQDWYDGYSVQATIDPKTIVYRTSLPMIQR